MKRVWLDPRELRKGDRVTLCSFHDGQELNRDNNRPILRSGTIIDIGKFGKLIEFDQGYEECWLDADLFLAMNGYRPTDAYPASSVKGNDTGANGMQNLWLKMVGGGKRAKKKTS